MAIAERLPSQTTGPAPDPSEPPPEVAERTSRGRARMRDGAAGRNLALKFWRGDQYVYQGMGGVLINQNTLTIANGSGKPRWRVRQVRNLFIDIVAHEVSAATQRIPSYQIDASTTDPADVSAASLSEKLALYGYDKWKLRNVSIQVVSFAVVADEGFAWPFWDTSVGPYIQEEDPETGKVSTVGEGEVGVRIFGPNEVYWEPGLKFDESRWHAVEQAMPLEQVYAMDGYLKSVSLEPDASTDAEGVEHNRYTQHTKMVLVTQYLERPSLKRPNGRWLTIANGKVIVRERPYPCSDGEGNVLDEPVLHKLSYFTDPDDDRDMGLGRHLVDPQRTINDCINKMLEWKNLAMNPQVIIRNGEFKQQLTDEPGAVYHAVGSGEVTWRPVPPLPDALNTIKAEAVEDMARIAAQNDIPSQVESGKGIQALIEKDAARRQSFLADVAEWHSRLMRHCLYLVQKHYTEDRLIKIRGDFGAESISDFRGTQLRNQTDVRVMPASIEPQTKEARDQRIMNYLQMGAIPPEAAMAAIESGATEGLIQSYAKDEARAGRVIQRIKDGTFLEMPMLPTGRTVKEEGPPDPYTGQPTQIDTGIPEMAPGYMPRYSDNLGIWRNMFEDFTKTEEFERIANQPVGEPDVQFDEFGEPVMGEQQTIGSVISDVYMGILQLEAEKAGEAQAAQAAQAEQMGMSNAAAPPQKPNPSLPALDGGNAPQ